MAADKAKPHTRTLQNIKTDQALIIDGGLLSLSLNHPRPGLREPSEPVEETRGVPNHIDWDQVTIMVCYGGNFRFLGIALQEPESQCEAGLLYWGSIR